MLFGIHQITIPSPDEIALPDFQPLWAWISVAVVGWYVMAALLMRWIGWHKNNVAKYNGKVEQIKKDWHLEDENIWVGMSYDTRENNARNGINQISNPVYNTVGVLIATPILTPLYVVFKALYYPANGLYWLAGGYQKPNLANEDKTLPS